MLWLENEQQCSVLRSTDRALSSEGQSVELLSYVLSGCGWHRQASGQRGWSGKRSSLLVEGPAVLGSFSLPLAWFPPLWKGSQDKDSKGQISKKAGKAAQMSDHQKTTLACCLYSPELTYSSWIWKYKKARQLFMPNYLWNIFIFDTLTPYLQTKKMTTRMIRTREIICRAFVFIKLPVVWRDSVETNLWTEVQTAEE